MKGIYLTEQGKQEIEAKIAELEEYKDSEICKDPRDWSFTSGKQAILKEILSSPTILPVEKSWESLENHFGTIPNTMVKRNFPQGVIIQPKQ
jgi:hypothetical protein